MFKIFFDSFTEFSWFKSLHPDFLDAEYQIIKKNKFDNPECIRNLLTYDKPDIILCYNNKPVLVLEITKEVPTGHNIGQRFARLVRAAEQNVLSIYFFPFSATKHGTYSNICQLNARLLSAIFQLNNIHSSPILTVNWPTDDFGEVIYNDCSYSVLKNILKDYFDSEFDINCISIKNQLKWMNFQYNIRVENYKKYDELPDSIKEFETESFITQFQINRQDLSSQFLNRNKTYVYFIGMSSSSCKRQDPYTGMQFIYDYLLCRNGETPADKKANLVLYFPEITRDIWFKNNPNNPNTKSSNWYLTANLMLFKDGTIFNIVP